MNNRFIDKARGRRRQVRVRGYMRDRGMYDYEMDGRRRRRDYDMDERGRRDYGSEYRRDYRRDYGDEHYRHEMPSYSMYGTVMPSDYGRREYEGDYRRSDYDYEEDDYDYASGEEEYKKELEKWSHKLKQHDRFNMNKEEVIRKAKEMQIKFDEFSEEEFYAIYLLYLSMHKNQFNDPHMYIKMAKDFLSYKDFKLNPSETVWVVLNDIVLGKEGE